MSRQTIRGRVIREFILSNVEGHPHGIARVMVDQLGVSRQVASWHLKKMVDEGSLIAEGSTRAREYRLAPLAKATFELNVTPNLAEDVVWRETILPLMGEVSENVIDICQYGFTETLNNVVDHSGSDIAVVSIEKTAMNITLDVKDDGIGIWQKLQADFGLNDARHALLELSKGKLSSNEEHHTGEGIFFASRMFDSFTISSGTLTCLTTSTDGGWLMEAEDCAKEDGTAVTMRISPYVQRTMTEVFNEFAGPDSYNFRRTHVPISLAKYDSEQLVSRSQAKRVLARFDRFDEVILDFQGIYMIGRAFADEIFRVYRRQHPEVQISVLNASPIIERIIAEMTAG